MRTVDGSRGEGGGQVLRLSLALSAATGEPVRVRNIRSNRPKPGLKAQHLTGVTAMAALCDATVNGASPGSREVTFRPGPMRGGSYRFDVGTAGSVTLLLQQLLPACAASGKRFTFQLQGGTDVKWSPPWDYLAGVHAPLLARLGVDVRVRLKKRGYYPEGGGRVEVEVSGSGFHGAEFTERGPPREVLVRSHAAHLPERVPREMARAAADVLDSELDAYVATTVDTAHEGPSTGTGVNVVLRTEGSLLGANALGEKGVPAGDVGREAAHALLQEVESGAALDHHQADQLVPYLALEGGAFTARTIEGHAETELAIVEEWLDVDVTTRPTSDGVGVHVTLDP